VTHAARPLPLRTCVACRTERPKRELVRVVRRPDGVVLVDDTGRLPGRGAYLCADQACWSTALKRQSLERALEASLPPKLLAQLTAGGSSAEGGLSGS